ncbi:MAG TPA: helix-turn-helix domain-containing protein [Pirellulales bacterium]|jgi:transposase-like protein|nr:helix-turn-helix domain-containing protein [Pirellulales bacterium]
MNRQRKQLAGPEKLAILKRYLVEKTPISDLCDQYGLQPSQIYYWQAQLFEHGASVFERKPGRQGKLAESAKDRKIALLEAVVAQRDAKLAQKNEVIGELMEENVRAKKANGEL